MITLLSVQQTRPTGGGNPLSHDVARVPAFYLVRKAFQPREMVILGVLLLEIVAFGLKDVRFITVDNLLAAARFVSLIGIAAIGTSMVIISGGIDLSCGAIYGLSGVVMAVLMTHSPHPWPGWLSVIGAMAVGTGFGLFNGVAIAYLRVPPFIVTLGTLSIAAGTAFLITGGQHLPSGDHPLPAAGAEFLRRLDAHYFAHPGFVGINLAFVVLLVLAVVAAFVLVGTPFGRYVHAIGGSETAARYAGVPVERVKVAVYTLAGALASLSGIFYVARFKGINSGVGPGEELDIIAAAVVGGVSLSGGRGSPIGAVIGALIIKILRDGLVFNEVPQAGAKIAIGLFIVLAVLLDRLLKGAGRAGDA